MEAVACGREAGDAVDVVVELPRAAYGVERLRSYDVQALYQSGAALARRLEYLDLELSIGEVVGRKLRMRVHAGAVALLPAHHDRLPALSRAAEVGAAISTLGVVVERL